MSSKTLIYLEDNPVVSEVVKKALKDSGYNVIPLVTNMNTLDEMVRMVPDLVLINILNSTSENWKVLNQIRQREEIKNIPILIITSRLQMYDHIPGISLSSTKTFEDYITYPFKSSELLVRIENFLKQK